MRLHLPPGRRVELCLLTLLFMLGFSVTGSAQSLHPVGHLRAVGRDKVSSKALAQSAPIGCASTSAASPTSAIDSSAGKDCSTQSRGKIAGYLPPRAAQDGGWKVEPNDAPTVDAASGHGFSGFLSADSYPTQKQVQSSLNTLVTLDADFLHRGRKDLLTIDSKAQLHLLANNGDGSFAKPIDSDGSVAGSYYTGYASAVVYDYDKDGYPDVLARDSSNYDIAYFHNNHDGTFTLAKSLSLPLYKQATMMLGDVNGDKTPDLVIFVNSYDYSSGNSTLQVLAYLGDGSGDFSATPVETDYIVTGGQVLIPNRGIMLGANAGHNCLFFEMISLSRYGIYGSTVIAVDLNGDGSFGLDPRVSYDFPTANIYVKTENNGLSLADLNGDGTPDLTMSFNDGYIYTAIGNTDGSFQNARIANPYFAVYPLSWDIKDVDGDGYPDFVAKDFNTFEVLPGNGMGLFGKAKNYYTVSNSSNGGGSGVPGFNFVYDDINGDGIDDAVYVDATSNGYNRAVVLIGEGAGNFHGAVALPTNNIYGVDPGAYYGEEMFDADGDGHADLLLLDIDNPGVVVASDDGKGGLKMKRALEAKHDGFMTGEILGSYDFNHDGVKDLVLYSYTKVDPYTYNYSFAAALAKGDGTFAEPTQLNLNGLTLDSNPRFIAIGDVNGDGFADIVAAVGGGYSSTPATLLTFFGNADGSFQPAVAKTYGNSFNYAGIALADFNGDGKLDLLVSDDGVSGSVDPSLKILLGDGSGQYDDSRSVMVASGLQLRKILIADLNGDGRPDLVLLSAGQTSGYSVTNVNRGALVYLNNGDATFNYTSSYELGATPGTGLLADLNGDGKLDLVFSVDYPWNANSADNAGLQLLLGHGDGTFGAPSNLTAPSSVTYLAAGDLNGDGAVDLMTFSYYLGSVAVLRNQSGSTMTLSSDVNSITQGQGVNLTATVAPTVDHRPTPTGSVKFMLGSQTLGEASLQAGTATLHVDSLPVGSDAVKAVYEGDDNYSANFSGAVTAIKVVEAAKTTPDFTLNSPSASVSMTRGSAAAATLVLSANAGYVGAVTLSAMNLPRGLTVSFAQPTINLQAGQTVSTAVFISSTASTTSASVRSASAMSLALFVPVFGALLGFGFLRRRSARRACLLGALLLAVAGMAMLSGCGSSSTVRTAAKGDYVIVVKATPSVSGVAAKAVNVSVHVD